jgi:hypothetical protein
MTPAIIWAPLFLPPVQKHPDHKADRKTYGNQPKCLLMNFNGHGDDSPFRPPMRRAESITLGPE